MCEMGTEKTHYQVLGVSVGASADEIRRAYRERMRAVHPDINVNSANESQRMTELNIAWKTLSSPQLRRAYDASTFVSNSSFVNSGLRNSEPVISYAPARFPLPVLLVQFWC